MPHRPPGTRSWANLRGAQSHRRCDQDPRLHRLGDELGEVVGPTERDGRQHVECVPRRRGRPRRRALAAGRQRPASRWATTSVPRSALVTRWSSAGARPAPTTRGRWNSRREQGVAARTGGPRRRPPHAARAAAGDGVRPNWAVSCSSRVLEGDDFGAAPSTGSQPGWVGIAERPEIRTRVRRRWRVGKTSRAEGRSSAHCRSSITTRSPCAAGGSAASRRPGNRVEAREASDGPVARRRRGGGRPAD